MSDGNEIMFHKKRRKKEFTARIEKPIKLMEIRSACWVSDNKAT